MLDLGSYLLGALQVAVVVAALGFAAHRLRRRLLPAWSGAPARLVEVVVAVALVTWLSQLLGSVELFERWTILLGSVLIGLATWFLPAGGAAADGQASATAARGGPAAPGSAGPGAAARTRRPRPRSPRRRGFT